MARQTTVTVTDDLDGSANAKEVSFALDGSTWTIDLSTKNRAALEKALKPYITKATQQPTGPARRGQAGMTGKRGRGGPSRRSSPDIADIRVWAKNNGYPVSDRGRVSAEVQNAYASAH